MTKRTFLLTGFLIAVMGGAFIGGYGLHKFGVIEIPGLHRQATPFQPSADAMRDIDVLLSRARDNDTLALIVMGANWCHDSQAFVRHLADPAVQNLTQQKYEILLVDVGYLERGRTIINRFGMPVIYGTPTVLIIDPVTEKQLNHKDMQQWRDADKFSSSDAFAYLSSYANAEPSETEKFNSPELEALLKEIDAFEIEQSERIYKAFAVIGPMLALPKSERPENFMALWKELSEMRYAITVDLARLRNEVQAKTFAGEADIKLVYPDYPLFIDRDVEPK